MAAARKEKNAVSIFEYPSLPEPRSRAADDGVLN
jgi:hypothetical protein